MNLNVFSTYVAALKWTKNEFFVKPLNFLIHGTLQTAFRGAKRQWEFWLRQKLSDTSGIWRDLDFDPNSEIFAFFSYFGQVLKVHKCVLKSNNFGQN